MDELSQARAELALLEEQARRLLKELLRVRAAVATQRAKVDELIRTRPTAFNLLPTEILLSILDFGVRAEHPKRKYELAGVCRRWRDIVFDSASFWATIHVATSVSSIMTHLERSHGAPLDITIEGSLWSRSQHLTLIPSLDIVGPLAHRWHRLSIIHLFGFDDDDDDDDDTTLPEFIIKRISHLRFPSLKYVAISYCNTSLAFLSPASAPALEHLELDNVAAECTDFPQLTALKTLQLDFYNMDHPTFPYLIPTQALTKLSISGFVEELSLRPNSIHFPSLKMLEISCPMITRQFMKAIVAPNLERLHYTSFDVDDPPSVTLRGFRSEFTNVRHLSFNRPMDMNTPKLHYADAAALCKAFPGVRHVELKTDQLSHLFDPTPSNAHARRPIDFWTELESLTLCGMHPTWLEPNQFLAWLVGRQALELRKLYVRLVQFSDDPSESFDFEFFRLYEVLRETCILELDNFRLTLPEMDLYMPVNSRLRVVSTSFPYTELYSLYMGLAFAGANKRTYG